MTPSVANQPCPHIHVRSFGWFDEITDLVEKASDLTLACVAAPAAIRNPDPPTPEVFFDGSSCSGRPALARHGDQRREATASSWRETRRHPATK
jgi:hypothetical protein